jgi:hypothetical protein
LPVLLAIMRVSQPVVIGVNRIDESLGQRIRSYLFSVLRQQVKLYIILSFVLLVLLLRKLKKVFVGSWTCKTNFSVLLKGTAV